MKDLLTSDEKSRLRSLEKIVEGGWRKSGEALMEIRDSRLWKAGYKSWAEYCTKRWGYTKQHCNRLIAGTEAVKALPPQVEPIGSTLHESQARELAKAPTEKRAQVIDIASSKAEAEERPMTARDVRDAREEVEDDPQPGPEKPRIKIDWTHYTRKSLEEIYRGILKNDPENLTAHASLFSQYADKLNHL